MNESYLRGDAKKTLTKQIIAEATKLKRACGSTFFGGGLGLEPFHVPHKTPNIKIMLSADNELKPVLPPSWVLSPIDI